MITISFSLSNICFVCVKERSQGDVSFAHPKHIVFIDSINRPYSLNSVSEIYFKLASISKLLMFKPVHEM